MFVLKIELKLNGSGWGMAWCINAGINFKISIKMKKNWLIKIYNDWFENKK